MRIHASYLINPAHVVRIERFRIMSDGSHLPVPEKKYTAVKTAILH
ncbi:LytTR family transcriptional regulator DNA-binding domain-containing protein [Lactimicrobium sp.]